MKRFIVLAGYCYYPSGGFNDFVGAFDSLTEAIEFAEAKQERPPPLRPDPVYEWWHIWDSKLRTVVAQSKYQPWSDGEVDFETLLTTDQPAA